MATSTTLLLVIKPLGTTVVCQLPGPAVVKTLPCLWARGQSQPCQQAQQPEERPLPALDPKRAEGRKGEGPGLGGPTGSPPGMDSRETDRSTSRFKAQRSDGRGWPEHSEINQPNRGFTKEVEALRPLRGDEDDRQHLWGLGRQGGLQWGHLTRSPDSPSCSPVLTRLREKELTPPEYLLCAGRSADSFHTVFHLIQAIPARCECDSYP